MSFAHFDADLHSSTACALDWITPLLEPGALLLFDEFCGEDAAEERAFLEWSERTGVRTSLLTMFGREPSGTARPPTDVHCSRSWAAPNSARHHPCRRCGCADG